MQTGAAEAGELAARFDAVSDAVAAFVEGCDADAWRAVTEAEGWTVGAVCRHVARGYEVHAALIRRASRGEPLPTDYTWETIHESNARQAAEWAGCDQAETLALLQRHGRVASRIVRGLSDAQLEREAIMPLFGDGLIPTRRLVRVLIEHPRAHLDSVRKTAGE